MIKLFKRLFLLLFLAGIVLGVLAFPYIREGYQMYIDATEQMPIEQKVEEIRAQNGYTSIEEISPVFVNTLLESEDRRFYSHHGFDIVSFTRAIAANVATGSFSQGGSTITQQLAKNMYFSFDKQIERKVAELLVAFKLESMYSKDEILALYCSVAYFGQNCYGVKHAAGYYYSTEPLLLDETQSKQLVRALKAPSVYNPSTM